MDTLHRRFLVNVWGRSKTGCEERAVGGVESTGNGLCKLVDRVIVAGIDGGVKGRGGEEVVHDVGRACMCRTDGRCRRGGDGVGCAEDCVDAVLDDEQTYMSRAVWGLAHLPSIGPDLMTSCNNMYLTITTNGSHI